jgi:methionyl-tRNA synthetase
MVSGSDQHGTPITLRAEDEGVEPKEIVERFHASFLDTWEKIGIDFDLFTTTGTHNHTETVQRVFLSLLEQGYIYKDTMLLPYSAQEKRFLPDRYVEGTCPHCGHKKARGDQCDQCGKTLNPIDLIEPQGKRGGGKLEFRESEHFFLKLTAFEHSLLDWIKRQEHWRPNVLNFSRRFIEDGLKDRAITRDIEWGIPIPLDGYGNKRIYVWFEAVIGYWSAAQEWAKNIKSPSSWEQFLTDPATKGFYFMGKDNIPFHTIIWPSILMGVGSMNLPYDVPANEFLNLEGAKLSTSGNWAIWLPDYLENFDPDPLRYVLSATMPETSDTNFSWDNFVSRNNRELVATYGNLVHRILTLTYMHFNGKFPCPGKMEKDDHMLMDMLPQSLKQAGERLEGCQFRDALGVAMNLAQSANRYIDFMAPWKTIKTDPTRTATTLWICINVISCLRTLMYPFLPFSSQNLHEQLGNQGAIQDCGWELDTITPGQCFPSPQPLFKKLDDSIADHQRKQLEEQSP